MKIPRWIIVLIAILLFAILFLPYLRQPVDPSVIVPPVTP
jgi:hypothetical protein